MCVRNGSTTACFMDWQTELDHTKWAKLIHTLQKTGLDWRERKLICKLYMGHRFYSPYPAITLPRKAFKGLEI
jgi:hypothetical protein